MQKGTLYLLPCGMGNNDPNRIIPGYNLEVMNSLQHFIVENGKTARQFLKDSIPGIKLQERNYYELNNHTHPSEYLALIKPLLDGNNVGLMSEAGCPGIADPGAEVVKMAHREGIKVVPLVGPSSIFMALMASGFNGQSFAFNGYLPKDKSDRSKRLKELEKLANKINQAQLFIETPYRNEQLIQDMIQSLMPSTKILIASGITTEQELIISKTCAEWKKNGVPNLSKMPCIFGIGA